MLRTGLRGSLIERFNKYAASLKQKVDLATDIENLEVRFVEKRTLIESILNKNEWLRRLPGKQILGKYLTRFPTLQAEDYMRAAASLILERGIAVAEINRLRDALLEVPGAKAK